MKRLWFLLLLILVHPSLVMAQSQFGNLFVLSGATCPPVSPPANVGTLYTCTGDGSLYNWTGLVWNPVVVTSTIAGTIADTQVAVGSAADTIAGSADLTSTGGADITIGQESSIPAYWANWWPNEGGVNVYNNSNLTTGVKIESRGIDNATTFGAALEVLSYAEAADNLATGIWVSSWRTSALAATSVYGIYVNSAATVDTARLYTYEATLDIGLFPNPAVTIDLAYNYKTTNTLFGTLTLGYGFKDTAFILGGAGGAEAVGTWFSFHADEHDLTHITNAFYSWYNSDGVYEVREDDTFDMVGQAIPRLHNPQFTKYTVALANYESCIPGCQWNGNVAEIGTEAGGGGTLRALRLVGTGITMIPFTASGSGLTVANVGLNSCGTTAATIAGGPNSFEVTVGATSGTQCRVTFPTAAANRWNCAPTNNVTGNLVRAVAVDTTHVDLVGVFVAADVLNVICVPR